MRTDQDIRSKAARAEAAPPPQKALPHLRDVPAWWDPRASWSAYLFAAGVLLTLVFALLDPGPSRGLALGGRFAFWAAHVLVPLAILQTVQIGFSRVRSLGRLHDWVQILLSGVIGAALFAPLALLLDQVFDVADAVKETGEPVLRQLVTEFLAFLPASVLIWGGLNASRLLRLEPMQTSARPAETTPDPAAEFWKRLPKSLGRDIVALTAELHYLRVHTTVGDALILYAFGRAADELGPRGHRVHRSHWVADAHVAEVMRRGDRYSVLTDTGLVLPLSRTYRRQLRELCAQRAP